MNPWILMFWISKTTLKMIQFFMHFYLLCVVYCQTKYFWKYKIFDHCVTSELEWHEPRLIFWSTKMLESGWGRFFIKITLMLRAWAQNSEVNHCLYPRAIILFFLLTSFLKHGTTVDCVEQRSKCPWKMELCFSKLDLSFGKYRVSLPK